MIFVAIRVFVFFSLLTGVAYPLLMTGFAQVAFSDRANGSIVFRGDIPVGSDLIAQKFEKPHHFFPRPSAVDYNPMPSGGSNAGTTNADLKAKIEERRKSGLTGDLAFASGSGLDPHIRPEDASVQIPRIVAALKPPVDRQEIVTQQLANAVDQYTEGRQYRVFGEPRVNVLKLNLFIGELIQRESLKP